MCVCVRICVCVHVCVCCVPQDQDKRRPLSSLANLAITITDVQDMDPIFINLPYSTNIEEDSPPVSAPPPPLCPSMAVTASQDLLTTSPPGPPNYL